MLNFDVRYDVNSVPDNQEIQDVAIFVIYNVAMRESLFLCTTSLLPSQPKLVPIYTPGSRGASESQVPCSRVQHIAHAGFELLTLGS